MTKPTGVGAGRSAYEQQRQPPATRDAEHEWTTEEIRDPVTRGRARFAAAAGSTSAQAALRDWAANDPTELQPGTGGADVTFGGDAA